MPKVDVAFRVIGTDVPADHGYSLLAAISQVVPSLHGDGEVGVHPISGRLIGNRQLALTDRSRLTIRLADERIGEVLPLAGRALDLQGATVHVGVPQTRPLIPAARLYSRLVVVPQTRPLIPAARLYSRLVVVNDHQQSWWLEEGP